MYKKLLPLKKDDHKDLRVNLVPSMDFARNEIMAPIVIDEIADIAREYPIVFPAGSRMPVALMGVEEGKNAYLSPDGSWRATYIPAHIRHYPFALTRINATPKPEEKKSKSKAKPKTEKTAPDASVDQISFAVMIDIDSPAVGKTSGAPIFDENGNFSATVQPIVDLMQQLVKRQAVTQQLVASLESAGVLAERTVRIQQDDGQEKRVTGLRVIDEKALNSLDDKTFGALRNSGALPLVYAALLSWANFRQGPIGRSHPLSNTKNTPQDEIVRFN